MFSCNVYRCKSTMLLSGYWHKKKKTCYSSILEDMAGATTETVEQVFPEVGGEKN